MRAYWRKMIPIKIIGLIQVLLFIYNTAKDILYVGLPIYLSKLIININQKDIEFIITNQ